MNIKVKSLCPFPARDGAVRGSSEKVGTGPEYSSLPRLDLQQQQPRPSGGNVWRLSHGSDKAFITSADCLTLLYMAARVSSSCAVFVLLWCSCCFTYATCDDVGLVKDETQVDL